MKTMEYIEAYRLSLKNKLIMPLALGILFSVIIIFAFTIIGVIISIITMAVLYEKFYRKYNNQYRIYVKDIVLKEELESVFSDVKVDFTNGFSLDEVKSYRLVDTYSTFESDDYIEGRYQNCFFRRSDIHIQEIVQSGKSRTRVTRFKGQWLIMDFDKQFSKYTVIKEKQMLANGKPGGFFNSIDGASKIEFEDEKFNKQFVVYTTDGHEAFYLLTPHFMEKIIQLEYKHQGRVYVGFINSQLHVAIDSRENLFELSIFNTFDEAYLRQIKSEIEIILDLIQNFS